MNTAVRRASARRPATASRCTSTSGWVDRGWADPATPSLGAGQATTTPLPPASR
jgi:hypothetical protein